ncbi:MAG: anthranilate phosphoribosyltransferase [Candidatus Omnitrophica bacterium]|nr:anthranilate phosphoribosyltransferase [Candidatus Omnitrophota bacterium]
MLKEAIKILEQKTDLTQGEMRICMEEIMTGHAAESDIESFLLLLKAKGETVDEITGASLTMRKFVKRIKAPTGIIFDTCGTGGDNAQTFNISTIVAFVLAGADIRVAKHGNRGVSSSCGSADVLEALGVNLLIDAKAIEQALEEIGVVFLFAPNLHPAMKYAMPVRKRLKTRTIFNILGPLTNPAFATHQIIGVFDRKLIDPLIHVLANLGLSHAMVVHGEDGLDEITTCDNTLVCEYKDNDFKNFTIEPDKFGISQARLADLKGGDAVFNAQIVLEVLKGKDGPKKDIVLLNAGVAIYVADSAATIEAGIEKARESIGSGKALDKLQDLKAFTNR